MDLSLDALCEDLQSCFDPDPAATARATNLVAAQVEETVVSELESLAKEVLQEAQVNQSEISFEIRDEDVGGNGQKRRSNEGLMNSKEKTMRVEPEPMAAVFFDVGTEEEEEEEMATTIKVKTEAKEVKRRGKYNKDKAGNLGKLGRKAMKEVKVEQVKAKQVVIPKKELGGRMKIPCKNCNQEFSSAPEFNSHTIMCAKNLAQRMSSSASRGVGQLAMSQRSKLTIAPSPTAPKTKILSSTSSPFSITSSSSSSSTINFTSRPTQARIVRESPTVKTVTKSRFPGGPDIEILEPNITKTLASSIKITHIPDSPSPTSAAQFKAGLKDPSSLMKSLPQSTKILFTPSSTSTASALASKKPPGPPGPPGPGSKGPPGPPGPAARVTLSSKVISSSSKKQPPGPPGPQQPAQQMVCSKCRIILPSRAEFDAHIASKHLVTSSRASPLPNPVKSNSLTSSVPPAVRTPTPVKPKQAPKPPTPVFKCKKCHESFKTNSQLEGHKCWAECDKCSKTFTTKMKSEKHKVEEHTFRCSKCRQVLDSKENLGAHMDTEHSHFCDKCGSVFDNKILLASHVAKEHSYKCGYCTKLLDSEEAVLVHEQAEHAKCEVCEDEFTWVEVTHACYFTKNRIGPKSSRVVVQNVYFPGHTNYFI